MADASKPESASAVARVGLPVLFTCPAPTYNGVRLMETACAKRYRSARDDVEHTSFRECIGCATGAGHAAAHPDAIPAPKRKGKRRGDVMEGAVAEAMAKKDAAQRVKAARAKAAPSADSPSPTSASAEPSGHETADAHRVDVAGPEIEAPAGGADDAHGNPVHHARGCPPAERRPRGAPPPRAGAEAEAFRDRLRADAAERVRVLALIDGAVYGTDAARRAARACALRRVAGLPLSAVVEELGIDEAAAGVLVSRGRWVITRGLLQRRLDEDPRARGELDEIAPLIRELVRAVRADAGRARPSARGPRKAPPESPSPSIFDLLERGAA